MEFCLDMINQIKFIAANGYLNLSRNNLRLMIFCSKVSEKLYMTAAAWSVSIVGNNSFYSAGLFMAIGIAALMPKMQAGLALPMMIVVALCAELCSFLNVDGFTDFSIYPLVLIILCFLFSILRMISIHHFRWWFGRKLRCNLFVL